VKAAYRFLLMSWATAWGAQRRLVMSALLACKGELLYGSAHHRSSTPLSLRVTLTALTQSMSCWHSDVNWLKFQKIRAVKIIGGLGVLDPRLEAQAIRAVWVKRMLFSEEAPWRHLLWAELVDCAAEARTSNVLGHKWKAPSSSAAAKRHPIKSLALEILASFAALQPSGCPVTALPSWSWNGKAFTCAARPPIPSAEQAAAIVVCGSTPLEKLTVKGAYLFLLGQALADITPIPTLFGLKFDLWSKRWKWLCKSGLPMNVRQLMWRRWQDKLYLGATKDNPTPKCAFCDALVSSTHFAKECRVAKEARAILRRCWHHWTGEHFPDKWWNDEYSKDWAWMACFAFMVHALYLARVEVSKRRRSPTVPASMVARLFRANLSGHLLSLSWHYSFLDHPLRQFWMLDGAWLHSTPPCHLRVTVSWPSPPY
jgi:hypothetical protein